MDNFPFLKILFIIIYRSSQPLIITYQTQNENHRDFIKYFTFFFLVPPCQSAQITTDNIDNLSVLIFFSVYIFRIEADVFVEELDDAAISEYTYERTLLMEQRNEMLKEMRVSEKRRGKMVRKKNWDFFFSTSSSFRNISTQFMMS